MNVASLRYQYFFVLLMATALSAKMPPSARPVLLTEAEAANRVAAQFEREETVYQAALLEMERAEIVGTKVVSSKNGSLMVNAVKPLVLKRPPKHVASAIQAVASELEWAELIAEQQTRTVEQISMGANVYDDAYSEIVWRDTETREEFTVWTNVSLNHLSPITSFRDAEYDYLYFGFVTNYKRDAESKRLKFAKKQGIEKIESLWKQPPVRFSPHQFEYVVLSENPSSVPAKLYRQLDALLKHYLAHREELETAYRNAQTLEIARREYLKANPPEPKKTVVNFWKIEEDAPAE